MVLICESKVEYYRSTQVGGFKRKRTIRGTKLYDINFSRGNWIVIFNLYDREFSVFFFFSFFGKTRARIKRNVVNRMKYYISKRENRFRATENTFKKYTIMYRHARAVNSLQRYDLCNWRAIIINNRRIIARYQIDYFFSQNTSIF